MPPVASGRARALLPSRGEPATDAGRDRGVGGHRSRYFWAASPYRARTSGTASASYRLLSDPVHSGGVAPPVSVHAACRAAPSATYSPGAGTETGTLNTVGAISRTAGET